MLFSITSLQVVTPNLWSLMNIQKAVIVVYDGLANDSANKCMDSANDTVWIKVEYQDWDVFSNVVQGDAF